MVELENLSAESENLNVEDLVPETQLHELCSREGLRAPSEGGALGFTAWIGYEHDIVQRRCLVSKLIW